jgi:hypothetical protein
MTNTIYRNISSDFAVTVKANGITLDSSGSVQVSVVTLTGTQCVEPKTAAMTAGVVLVSLTKDETNAVPAGNAMLVVTGGFGVKRFALACEDQDTPARSALFVKDIAVEAIRRDRLMLLASTVMPEANKISDDFLWGKLVSAESEIAHDLRVPLVPTAFFPQDPTPAEITALNGMPWGIDPGYDYSPNDFSFNDKWGMIKLRNKPLKSVSRVRFAYPGGPSAYYDLPLDWVRPDRKYGIIQFVPSSTAFAAPLNAFVMQAIGNGRTIPIAMQISYVAGIEDAAKTYPELVDVILKKTVLKVIDDGFLPQSGSISADGLSQSLSVDMDKYHDAIGRTLNGGKGSNGGLMTAIHGIRVGVV